VMDERTLPDDTPVIGFFILNMTYFLLY